jgi:hypothetical protein
MSTLSHPPPLDNPDFVNAAGPRATLLLDLLSERARTWQELADYGLSQSDVRLEQSRLEFLGAVICIWSRGVSLIDFAPPDET